MPRRRSAESAGIWLWLAATVVTPSVNAQALMRTETVYGLRLPAQIGGAERASVKPNFNSFAVTSVALRVQDVDIA